METIKILIIILSIIGLLKIVELLALCVIEIYYRIVKIDIEGVSKSFAIFKDDIWYVIPTIGISKVGRYLEIQVSFLCFQYDVSYKIDKVDE